MAKLILLKDDGSQEVLRENVSDNIIERDVLLRSDYIAVKLWCKEDIASTLKEKGFDDNDGNVALVINTGALNGLNDCDDREWFIIGSAIKSVEKNLEKYKIRSAAELEEYILNEYDRHDVELSSLFFDVEVEMKEADILEAYASIQNIINGDSVIRYESIETDSDGKVIGGVEAEDFIPEGKYEDIYNGNCKDFLQSFNGREEETGFCRYDGEDLLDFIW